MANIDRENRDVTRSGHGTQVPRRRGYEPFAFSAGEFFNNPFSTMRRMHEEMDRVFAESLGARPGTAGFGGLTSWSPVVEVAERDNEMVVCAELPGLKPEEVKVELPAMRL